MQVVSYGHRYLLHSINFVTCDTHQYVHHAFHEFSVLNTIVIHMENLNHHCKFSVSLAEVLHTY